MNNLVNLIVIWISLFYGNILFKKIKNPLAQKITNILLIIFIQFIYEQIKNLFRKKNISNSKILNRGINRGSLIVLGNSILKDIIDLSSSLPNLVNFLNTNYGKTTFSILPFFLSITFKSLIE
jgi:hypothetical protein